MDLKELESGVDPKIHWYYQSKKIPLVNYVKKIFNEKKIPLTLIDVGSGSGFFMYELQEQIPELISKIYLVDIGYSNEEIAATRNQFIEKTLSLPPIIENSVVVMMDVLEHLEDDYAMLSSIKKNTAGNNNHFFITVPAFMSLWSGHDVYLGHYRRYTGASLNSLLSKSDYHKESTYYIYGSIFPLVWLSRKFATKKEHPESDMKPSGALVNGILKGICSLEMPFRRINKLAGVSVVAEGKI
ncbi:MAG: methyltransferase domain-containing protein [Chitinophagales bacterium]